MATPTRIFLTGASGYIGGDVLHALREAHPEYVMSVLVRDEAKAGIIAAAYPDVRTVLGDLDSAPLIEEQASQADVVIHAASSSHINSVEAIARGLSRRDMSSPATWIQVSGASVLSISDIFNGRYGEGTTQVFSDLDGADAVRDIIRENARRRVVDNFILNLAGPQTALIFPPIIYGPGRGVVKQRSVQIPELARVAIETGTAVQVGEGQSTWSNVHITDVSDVFVKLVEKAGQDKADGLWNKDGVYFVGNASLSFGEISQKIAAAAQSLGLVNSPTVKHLAPEEANNLSSHAAVLWGTNARQDSQRARQLLGWQPKGRSLEEEIPRTVGDEGKRLDRL
ncbi:NAD(P)-binding protein [Aspergillus aurantiobrunneus]